MSTVDQDLLHANHLATDIYMQLLGDNDQAMSYLVDTRGISEAAIKEARLGYAVSNDMVTPELKAKRLPWQHLATRDGERDYFRDRIVMPISTFGSVQSFTSRAYPTKDPVHQHLRGPIHFVYNQDALIGSKYIFVVESPICALTLKQNGVRAIARLGNAMLPTKSMDKGTKIYHVPDRESTNRGELSALRLSASLYLAGFHDQLIVHLPPNGSKVDVNSFFMKHDLDDFRKFVKSAFSVTKQEVYDADCTRTWDETITELQKRSENKQHAMGDDLAAIRSTISLVDVVGEYAAVQQEGDYFRCNCPLHKENKPSFTIYPDSNSWYCFGCQRGGDNIAFLQSMEGLNFRQAVAALKARLP